MKSKKLGIGSLTIVLFILAIVWSISIGEFCIGDTALNVLGLRAWSNVESGTHFTVFYSMLFLIPSVILSYKYPEYRFAKSGRILSLIYMLLIVCLMVSLGVRTAFRL